MTIKIAVINYSTNITNAQINVAIADINSQINNEFHSAWGIVASLYVPTGTPASTDYQLILMDNFGQSNILGYHELTGFGTPIAYVFYENAVNNSTPWTVPASHECLEMLIDPNCNLSVSTNESPYQNGGLQWSFAFEVCDPVQNVAMAYTINDTAVSNFVYPTWFQSTWGLFETQFDYQYWLYLPFQVGYGGAIMVNEEGANLGWQELYGDTVMPNGSNPIKPIKPTDPKDPIPLIAPTHLRCITQKPLSRRTRYVMNRKYWKRSVR